MLETEYQEALGNWELRSDSISKMNKDSNDMFTFSVQRREAATKCQLCFRRHDLSITTNSCQHVSEVWEHERARSKCERLIKKASLICHSSHMPYQYLQLLCPPTQIHHRQACYVQTTVQHHHHLNCNLERNAPSWNSQVSRTQRDKEH